MGLPPTTTAQSRAIHTERTSFVIASSARKRTVLPEWLETTQMQTGEGLTVVPSGLHASGRTGSAARDSVDQLDLGPARRLTVADGSRSFSRLCEISRRLESPRERR